MSDEQKRTVRVGRAWSRRHRIGGSRHHAIRKRTSDDDPRHDLGAGEHQWRTLCADMPATHEYLGYVTAVSCEGCRRKLGL